MHLIRRTAAAAAGILMAFAVISSQAQSIFTEQGKLIRAPQAVTWDRTCSAIR